MMMIAFETARLVKVKTFKQEQKIFVKILRQEQEVYSKHFDTDMRFMPI